VDLALIILNLIAAQANKGHKISLFIDWFRIVSAFFKYGLAGMSTCALNVLPCAYVPCFICLFGTM